MTFLSTGKGLGSLIGMIRRVAASAPETYVILNNHIRGQALANALELKRMLTGQRLNVPQTLTRHFPELAESQETA